MFHRDTLYILQQFADDLAADGLGQALPELHNSGVLVGSGAALDVVLNFLLQLVGALGALHQHNAGLDHLAANLIGSGGDTAFQNIGQLHDDVFDLKGSDPVAGGLDHVVSTANVPVEAFLIPPGQVAGVVVAIPPGLRSDLLIAFIAVGQAAGQALGDIDADLAGLTGVHLVALNVQQVHIIQGHGLTHGAQLVVVTVEVADDQGRLGLAEALQNAQARSVLELAVDLGVQGLAGSGLLRTTLRSFRLLLRRTCRS